MGKDQENQITHQEFEQGKDLKKVRPNVLIPNEKGDGASLERREESLLDPEEDK